MVLIADADAIFYFTYAATDPKIAADESAFIKNFEQQPVWQTLKAVKAKRAFLYPATGGARRRTCWRTW
jgi:iron complex transport system substrate-binding protein